jgi:uncharacterized protein YdaU (DUF1376 family)
MQPNAESRRIPYLRVWVDDIKGSCIDFSAAQFGAHMRMLLVAWERGHVPTDERVLKRIVGEIDWDDMPMVLARWRRVQVDGAGEVYMNARLERERERMIQDAERKRASGKLGAEKRWNSRRMAEPCRSDGGHNDGQNGETMPFPNAQIPKLPNSGIPESPESAVETKARKRARPADALVWSPSGFVGITDEDRAAWSVAYPDVPIDREIVAAHQHIAGHTEKQTIRKWRRFLVDWLARSQRWKDEAKAKGAAAPRRHEPDRSHIPEDCAPGQDHLFWDGTFPNIPSTYTDTAGNLRHTRTRKIICAAEA